MSPTSAPHDPQSMDATKAKNLDTTTNTNKQIEDLYKLIDGIKIATFTTRARDGSLVSRPMATRERIEGGPDIVFVTNNQSHKLDDLSYDNHVNVAYSKGQNWVSVSGTASLVNDRTKIKELYKPDLKAWFGDLGDGVHTGGPEDPRITLLYITADSVHYQLQDKSTPTVLFEVVKGAVTGALPETGPIRELGTSELNHARNIATQ
ncbi:uncharacterized protein EV422DRAFT_577731 [Fimicolochytrium jonesii]|uniref:uncharacterized protein n=1 Tax=Fimicolochytrium jonesii TaxID=1396493 RepID=UPI0022FE7188|nr:uncharacterized protein EV422DRAFT_577731 [Fimicolochytrium jonesii]KAI8821982.1 hypothetical protein EV422DRAFT_577731 [Fimicolochytrium jonesii]